MTTKVVVAISGGVDSTVSALLLKQKGYEIIGATLDFGGFCSENLVKEAADVAKSIGIEHHVVKCEDNFKKCVIDYFVDSYLEGKTPSPCPKCNREIKFKELLEFTDKIGAEKLATGHYAKVIKNGQNYELHRATDPEKDQSYFLAMLTPEYLSKVEFPIGEMRKEEVREIAKRFNLPVAEKKDSQDICFVQNGNYIDLIKKYRPDCFKKGNIVLSNGSVIGQHDGIINYTIGQRKGIGISSKSPMYVLKIDKEKNEVVVGDESRLYKKDVKLSGVNILAEDIIKPFVSFEGKFKLRSTSKPENGSAIIEKDGTGELKLVEASRAVTKGQLCVAYDGDRVVFGGWIE